MTGRGLSRFGLVLSLAVSVTMLLDGLPGGAVDARLAGSSCCSRGRMVDGVLGGLVGVGMPGIGGRLRICITNGGDSMPESRLVTSQKSASGAFLVEELTAVVLAEVRLLDCCETQLIGFPMSRGT